MSYTDTQLKQTLAKMLPEELIWHETTGACLYWRKDGIEDGDGGVFLNPVDDTQILHICWLVEQTIDLDNGEYSQALQEVCGVSEESFCPIVDKAIIHSSWQQRTIALAKVKGIEIDSPTQKS